MAKDKTKYQSIDYEFPKKLWMAAVWLQTHDDKLIPYFLPLLKNTNKEAIKYGKSKIDEFRASKEHIKLVDHVLLIPLIFSSLFPLKKEYWENPFIPNNDLKKIVSFCKALAKSDLYKIMITPTIYLDHPNETYLTAAFVFDSEEEKYLEELIKSSSHPVAPQYKNSAIYTIGEGFSYDLIKKEVFIPEKSLQN